MSESMLDKYCKETSKDFNNMCMNSFKDGKLSLKEKELIALSIAICVRCEGCIKFHAQGAINAGCTMEEIAEMVEVCVLMQGGPGSVYGQMALALCEEASKSKK